MTLRIMTQPLTSIIVLCYNQLLEATKPCIESILRNTPSDSYELILVDNNSADGTAEYLKSIAENNSSVKLQINNVNKGYAGGNNDGIQMADGQFIVLLNNDTLVPTGWLDGLLKSFARYPKVGLIGPVTNSAGNEQRIEIGGLNEGNFEEKILGYLDRQKDVVYFTEKLGFFCVAIRRSVIDKVGLLDESFGIGMFEDDDYCFRAKKSGFDLLIAEDSFVYHKGSLSFNKLAIKEYQELFSKNKELFRKKHDYVWTYADIAMSNWRRIALDLSLISQQTDSTIIGRIMSRVKNFDDSLYQCREEEKLRGNIDGMPSIKAELLESKIKLMELSDWATSLSLLNRDLKIRLQEMERSVCNRILNFIRNNYH